jgi:hypothetical protein
MKAWSNKPVHSHAPINDSPRGSVGGQPGDWQGCWPLEWGFWSGFWS